jgi:hypothetical protein
MDGQDDRSPSWQTCKGINAATMRHLDAPNGGRRRLHVAHMARVTACVCARARTRSACHSRRRVGLDLRETGRVDVLDLGRHHVDARGQREHVRGVVKLAWGGDDIEARGYQFLIIDMRGRMQKSMETCEARLQGAFAHLGSPRTPGRPASRRRPVRAQSRARRVDAQRVPSCDRAARRRERRRASRARARSPRQCPTCGLATNVECPGGRRVRRAEFQRVSIDTNTTSDAKRRRPLVETSNPPLVVRAVSSQLTVAFAEATRCCRSTKCSKSSCCLSMHLPF